MIKSGEEIFISPLPSYDKLINVTEVRYGPSMYLYLLCVEDQTSDDDDHYSITFLLCQIKQECSDGRNGF